MSTFYYPEDLGPEQDERDAAIRGRHYFVYVLETDFGHYVGHTARLKARMREHRDGEVWSTAGTQPELVWRSGAMQTRDEATSFEAALKSMRDSGAPRFEEITGLQPEPFLVPRSTRQSTTVQRFNERTSVARRAVGSSSSKDGVYVWMVLVGGAFGALLGLLWAFHFELEALAVGILKVFGLGTILALVLALLVVTNKHVLSRWPDLLYPTIIVGAVVGASVGLFWTFGFDFRALGVGIFKVVGLTAAFGLGLPIIVSIWKEVRRPS